MAIASEKELLQHPEIVHSAVVLVLKDDSFSLPTAPAQMARKTAKKLLLSPLQGLMCMPK